MQEYTAIIKQEGDWCFGWIEEIPGVNCQERTLRELRDSLKECLEEMLELNKTEALATAGDNYKEEIIAL